MLFQYNEGRKIIKIGNDLGLLQRVKARFELHVEISFFQSILGGGGGGGGLM